MSEGYNGYLNWETWLVALWINNDEGSQDFWIEQAHQALNDAQETKYFTKEDEAVFLLSDTLKDYFEDSPEIPMSSGFYYDLIMGALSVVDWKEVAETILEIAKEQV